MGAAFLPRTSQWVTTDKVASSSMRMNMHRTCRLHWVAAANAAAAGYAQHSRPTLLNPAGQWSRGKSERAGSAAEQREAAHPRTHPFSSAPLFPPLSALLLEWCSSEEFASDTGWHQVKSEI
jgi:hypothetical protein